MKKLKNSKRVLSIVLSIALVLGVITISAPGVKASQNDLVENGTFDNSDGSIKLDGWNLEASQEKAVMETKTLFADDFESGTSNWSIAANGTLATETSGVNGGKGMKLNVTGSNPYVSKAGFTFEAGKTYTASMWIKTDTPSAYAWFVLENINWGYKDLHPTTEWTKVTIPITVDTTKTTPVGIQFVSSTGSMSIDDFSITWEEESVIDTEVYADDFESGTSNWSIAANGTLETETSGVNGGKGMKLNVTGSNPYFSKAGFTFEAGKTYHASMWIKTDTPSAYAWFVLENIKWDYKDLHPTTAWQKVTIPITVDTTKTTPVGIQFVSSTGSMSVDNFSITCEEVKKGYTTGVGAFGAESTNGALLVDASAETAVTVSNNGSYAYSFQLKGEAGAKVTVKLGEQTVKEVSVNELTEGWNTISGTYTATADATKLSFTSEGRIYLDNIALYDVDEDRPSPEVTLSLDKVDVDESWYLKATDLSQATATFYKVATTIDGASYDVVMEKQGSKFVIWPSFFGIYGGSVPTQSFKIAKDAVISPVTTTGWSEVAGTKLTVKEDFEAVKKDGVWAEKTDEPNPEVTLSLDKVDVDDSWYLKATDLSQATASYYKVATTIDGASYDVVMEKQGSKFVIWPSFFALYGGSVPTQSFKIAKDAVISPVTTTDWSVVAGTKLTVKEDFEAVKKDGVWAEKTDEPNPEVTLSLDKVDVDDSWYLKATDLSQATATFYKVATTIDGASYDVVMEKQGSKFVIWPSFFGIYGGSVPTQSFKIAKDAVISPVTTTNWSVVAGTKLTVKEDFEATKKATGWAEEGGQQTHDTIIVSLGASNGIYNKGTVNEVFSAMVSGPTEMKSRNIIVKGTINADGTDRQSVIWFPGIGECFFYTDGASKKLIVSKDTKFTAEDGTEIQFDKNYEIDLQKGLIYEQDQRPEEKKPKNLKISFDRMVSESFMFSYKLSGGGKPEAGFYRTDAVVDGKETQILMEYHANDDAFFIYPNCFNATPVDGKDGYPTKTVELKKGAILTPVNIGPWSTNITGQPYKLTAKLSIVKKDGTWMDADYVEQIKNLKPLKVKIVFEEVKGRAATVKVVTPDGKSISDIYGDWRPAFGQILRGVLDTKTGKYTYTEELGAYSITGDIFYLDGLRLNELDGLQINKGTVLYPDASCKSLVPIEIVNQWRIVRDENDEWVVDKTFTTDYNLNTEQSGNVESNESGDGSNEETVPEEEDQNLTDKAKDDSSYDLSNIVFRGDAQDEVETPAAVQTTSMSLWVMILAAAVLLILAGSGLFLVIKGKKKNVKREE